MILLIALAALILAVPLWGGRLSALGELRLRATGWLVLALLIQILVISVIPDRFTHLHIPLHLLSYLLAAAFFVANRRVPGLCVMGIGYALNFAAITANGGVMPATQRALEIAGRSQETGQFANSTVIEGARLQLLGDVFAMPASWPLANVFSIGDVLLVLGAGVALWGICGAALLPPVVQDFLRLREHRGFGRMWAAQATSMTGDWMYNLAIVLVAASGPRPARALAILLGVQVAGAALGSLPASLLVDRVPRRVLMIGADAGRCAAVASLLLAGTPTLGHLCAVAVVIGMGGALHQPAFYATLPRLIPEDRLVVANALMSATYHGCITVGALLAGVILEGTATVVVFGANAATFAISACLLATVRIDTAAVREKPGGHAPLRELQDGIRFTAHSPLARGIVLVTGAVVLAGAIKMPIEPVFVLDTLGGTPLQLGLVAAAGGAGMLLGSLLVPMLARRWNRERLFFVGIVLCGLPILLAARAGAVTPVLLLWVCCGGGNAIGSVASESLIQERVPDAYRGRVLSTLEATINLSVLLGASVAAWWAGHVGIRSAYATSGALLLLAALACLRLVRPEPDSSEGAGTVPGSASAQPSDPGPDLADAPVGGRTIA
jgi:MFS family permease